MGHIIASLTIRFYGKTREFLFKTMQILAYILWFGLARLRLTCPFSLDWKNCLTAHVVSSDCRQDWHYRGRWLSGKEDVDIGWSV